MSDVDFSVMFVIGIAILAMLLVAFNTTGFATEDRKVSENFFSAEFLEKERKGALFVGTNFTDKFIPFNFAFEVDNLPETQTASIGIREISNGVLFGEKSVRYTLPKGDSLTVKFRIESTNALTPLIFRLDGKEFKYELREGVHKININEKFDKGSVLEITAASSNWKLWAPSLYRIDGLSIDVSTAKEDVDQYIFNVGDELDTLQGGRMDLYLKDNIGTLIIELNSKKVFDGVARDFQPIRFSKDELRKGQNIMTFRASENAKFRGEATLVLFYKQGDKKSIKTIINLTVPEHDNLREGIIRFKIVGVKEKGGVSVRIINRGETTFSEFARVETGFYDFEFEKGDVQSGISAIEIDALDNAAFLVKDLEVKIEKNLF